MIVGLNPKLPDFMVPKKKKSGSAKSAKSAADSTSQGSSEPVAGTSTGGQTTQVAHYLCSVLSFCGKTNKQ